MKKVSIYVILFLTITIITVSGTYAFFRSVAQNKEAISTGTHQLEVKYSGDVSIEGELELGRTKESGFRRELNIELGTNSLQAIANFFIRADEITEGFQSKALKWEIYELINNEEKYLNSGDFRNVTSSSKLYIAKGLTLSTTNRTFIVYLWLYGEEAGNEVIGAKLIGYIGAETETISGELSNQK